MFGAKLDKDSVFETGLRSKPGGSGTLIYCAGTGFLRDSEGGFYFFFKIPPCFSPLPSLLSFPWKNSSSFIFVSFYFFSVYSFFAGSVRLEWIMIYNNLLCFSCPSDFFGFSFASEFLSFAGYLLSSASYCAFYSFLSLAAAFIAAFFSFAAFRYANFSSYDILGLSALSVGWTCLVSSVSYPSWKVTPFFLFCFYFFSIINLTLWN